MSERPPTSPPPSPDPSPDRRVRQLVVGVAVAAALLFCCDAGLATYALLRPEGQAQAEPFADDPWQEGDAEEDTEEVAPAPEPTPSASPATTPSTGPGRISVVYEVTGQGRADILYSDANGELIWLYGARLPWRQGVRTDRKDQVLVQVTRTTATGKSITCSVTVDGGEPLSETVDDRGSRASCSG